eukprot:1004507-Rhodomonas_salina.1
MRTSQTSARPHAVVKEASPTMCIDMGLLALDLAVRQCHLQKRSQDSNTDTKKHQNSERERFTRLCTDVQVERGTNAE